MPKLIFDNCKKHLKGQQFPEADFTYGQLTATKLNRKMHLICGEIKCSLVNRDWRNADWNFAFK